MQKRATRVLCALAVLLVGLMLHLLSEQRSRPETTRAVPRWAPPPPVAPPSPAPPTPVEPVPPSEPPPGPQATKFVARLILGNDLMDLRVRGTTAEVRAALEVGAGRILSIEGEVPEDPWLALDFLCDPRRDAHAFRLANRGIDALGRELPVRVWTLGGEYPKERIAGATEMLSQLEAVAGVGIAGGIDVLVTPRVGSDVFPEAGDWSRRAGVYWLDAEFCAVQSRLRGRFAGRALRHELVHAFLHRYAAGFSTQRFVSEGLAEYLCFLLPGDKGIDIPADRLADDLARLEKSLSLLEKRGYRFDDLRMKRLVMLDPLRFYSVPLGYPIAQAAMAFVGGRVIEEAIRAQLDLGIVEAVAAIRWWELRQFVREGGRHGTARDGESVDDTDPHADQVRQALRPGVLAEIGVMAPEKGVGAERLFVTEMRSADRIREILATLREAGVKPAVVTDLSPAMDVVMSGLSLGEDLLGAGDSGLTANTPRELVAGLLARLADPGLIGIVREQKSVRDLSTVLPYDSRCLAEALAARGLKESGLIVCAATNQGLTASAMAERASAHLERIDDWGIQPTTVLVLDFSDGGGDAFPLACAFATQGLGLHVAYWRPSPP